MDVVRAKLVNLFGVIQQTLVSCKTVSIYGTLLLLAFGFTLWFDFRPFGMICAVSLGIFWCRHCATLQLQKSVHFDETIANLEQKLANLRSSRPITLRVGLASAALTIVALFHFLPWWMIFATALALVFFVKWKYDMKIVVTHESVTTQETQLDLDVEEFLPEINEINQILLKEVEEQCNYLSPGAEGFARTSETKNAAEQDEEIYVNMLIPEVSNNDFESSEQSASSSDEMFCPDDGKMNSTKHRGAKPKLPQTGNSTREKQIEFKVSHFNANSSSDSDDNISRGLCFGNEDDDVECNSRLNKQQNENGSAPRNIMSVSSLASNLLMDTVYKHLLDNNAIHRQPLQHQQGMLHTAGFDLNNPIVASISNTIRSIRLPTPAPQENDESTDEDVDSDFEILNPEELNNL